MMKNLWMWGLLALGALQATADVVWQIGTKDGTGNEFALAPDGYQDFLNRDFGWEDKFYLIGWSDPKRDLPYALPGTGDAWGGSSGGAGDRAHQVNILFDLVETGGGDGWKLVIDFADVHALRPPRAKVVVNGRARTFDLPAGTGGDETILKGDFSKAKPYALEIPLDADEIRAGANDVMLTFLEKSWAIFDDIRLEGPAGAKLVTKFDGAYVRRVKPATYQVDGRQPLLVDVEHLAGTSEVRVEIDGETVLKEKVEEGAYSFEAPMPAVQQASLTPYKVFVDDRLVRTGLVRRTPQPARGVAGYVDTRMGTGHSRWMLAPGPWTPFSLVKLAPDNQRACWQGGYETTIESIGTFSHIHEWTMAGFGTFPVTGELKTQIGDPSVREGSQKGYRSAFDKATEVCEAGYYAVTLRDYGIRAELTQTDRCGFQRYTYPAGQTPRVMLDFMIPAEYRYELGACEITQVGVRRVEGRVRQITKDAWGGRDQAYTVNFVAEFDRDIAAFGGWFGETKWRGMTVTTEAPKTFGAWAEFAPAHGDTEETVVQLRTAISYVDVEGARKNLAAEIVKPFGWDFAAVRWANVQTWNDLLGRVKIKTSDAREKKRFYTNMYRSFCSRNTFNDVDGRWIDPVDRVAQLTDPDARALGCDAFWNTFWNLNQVWNLIGPEWSARWTKSQLAMYAACGWLAKGPAGMKYIPVMVAEHEIPLMVSTWQMGIHAADPQKLLAAFVKMQTTPAENVGVGRAGNNQLTAYLKHHYVPSDVKPFSNSMEYSFDDWTVGQFAQAIGATEVAKTFADRGTWWKNAVNRDSGYCHLRNAKGEWEANFDPIKSGGWAQYTEGNAWQLTYFVPQDVPGLIEWIGRDRFLSRLTEGFRKSEALRYNAPNERYDLYPVVQGNQQSMHFAFLFNWAGEPWQTQYWSRSILSRYYGYGDANAWLGDEDQGQMSAWLVMASLGLFQTDGGCRVEPVYELASPLYEEAVIDLGGRYGRGRTFTIKAHGTSRRNLYIQRAALNGQNLDTFLIPAKSVLAGGTLELWMGPEPNRQWGVPAKGLD